MTAKQTALTSSARWLLHQKGHKERHHKTRIWHTKKHNQWEQQQPLNKRIHNHSSRMDSTYSVKCICGTLHTVMSIVVTSSILYLGYYQQLDMLIEFPHVIQWRYKVSKGAKIRNRYNQVPHLTQDTNGKVTNSKLDTTNESEEVSLFPAGDHKAHINRRTKA